MECPIMKLLNRYYNWVGNADIFNLIRRNGIQIDWVIEAGCHNGSDTLILAEKLNPRKLVAFEPDAKIRKVAEELFHHRKLIVDLYEYALSDVASIQYLNFMDGIEGSGSTFVAETGSTPVPAIALDSLNLNLDGAGLLWLDVEGHAVQALDGGFSTLQGLRVAKIEVQMHEMHLARRADLFEVIKRMKSLRLAPVRAPLHPGFFGDVLFIHRSGLKSQQKIWSSILTTQLFVLHTPIYPMLNKPSK